MNVSLKWTKPNGEAREINTTTEVIKEAGNAIKKMDAKTKVDVSREIIFWYRTLYTSRERRSQRLCWRMAVAICKKEYPNLDMDKIPSVGVCHKALKQDWPEKALYCIRHGAEAYGRKYGK